MKNYRTFTLIAVLVLASLACQTVSGVGGKKDVPPSTDVPSASTDEPGGPAQDPGPISTEPGNGSSSDSEFPDDRGRV